MTSLSKADAESALAEIIADRTLTRPHELASNMSKREFFAGLALVGLSQDNGAKVAARMSVSYADALIDALNETDPTD